MPSIEKHAELSLKRAGKEYRDVHEWMDGKELSFNERFARHRIANIPRFLPVVQKKFGRDAGGEYLRHIEDDYEHNPAFRLWKILRRVLVGR